MKEESIFNLDRRYTEAWQALNKAEAEYFSAKAEFDRAKLELENRLAEDQIKFELEG